MKYNRICIMLPTYHRHDTLLPIFIDSAMKTALISQVCFCFCVNAKDQKTIDFINQRFSGTLWKYEIITESSIQPNLAYYFNLMYDVSTFSDEDTLVSMFGDDMEFITDGWDTKLLELVNEHDGIGTFWCNDNYIARENLCVNGVWSRKFVEATGRPFMCELFPADMIDVVWYKVSEKTKTLHYLPDVIIQHNHNTKRQRIDFDATFERLTPLQRSASTPVNLYYAGVYATAVAGNLIEAGMGSWQ